MRYVYLLLFILFSFHKVFACSNILPNDPSKITMPEPPTNHGQVTGAVGIADSGSENNDCTLDCQCVFNHTINTWETRVATKNVCVFMNQCAFCKSTDKTCEIRFRDLPNATLYKEIFYADNPDKFRIQKCIQKTPRTVKCNVIQSLPAYDPRSPVS